MLLHFALSLLVNAAALYTISQLIPGIRVQDFTTALIAVFILGVLNVFLKPILMILTLPVNLLTFGLFSYVLSAVVLWLAGRIVPGFEVTGFIPALVGAIFLAFVSSLLQTLIKNK